jgi:hypothetical protein
MKTRKNRKTGKTGKPASLASALGSTESTGLWDGCGGQHSKSSWLHYHFHLWLDSSTLLGPILVLHEIHPPHLEQQEVDHVFRVSSCPRSVSLPTSCMHW